MKSWSIPSLVVLLVGTSTSLVGAWTVVGPGIEYQQFTLPDPNNVFVARMARDNLDCIIESSIAQGSLSGGTERVSGQADRYDDAIGYWFEDWGRRNDVVVAINGDFWNTDTGVPLSGQVHSGWFAKQYTSPAFAWTMGRIPMIAYGYTNPQMVTYFGSGVTQGLDGINRSRDSDDMVLYTPQYDSDTNTDNSGVEVLVEMGRPNLMLPSTDPAWGYVRQIRQNQGSTPIPFDHVVLSATGSKAATLLANVAIGSRVGLSQTTAGASDWLRTYASVGGGEVFLWDGQVVGGQVALHPRTAVAYNDDHVFFVVVDGRDPGVSIGMNMQQLGEFCLNYLGAQAGINLDGGGSSTMVVNGVVKNKPSDGSERYVANGLLMIVRQPKLQHATFNPGDVIKTTGSANVRLGPGTNYAVLATVSKNTQGQVLDHSLRGVYAKGYYWWKCNFAGTVGWVAESLLTRVSSGSLPTITQHPSDIDACHGQPAAFTVSAVGQGTLSYRWQKHGVDLSDDGRIVGAASPTLTINNVGDSDTGSYRCVVTDANGSVTSYSAALMPPRPPTIITEQPRQRALPRVPPGHDVFFTVSASGSPPIGFRWQKDGHDLSDDGHYEGTGADTLTIHDVHTSDDGAYRCRVTAGCGTVYSDGAPLAVATPDFDGDNDVDQEDFGLLQMCLTGTSVPQTDPNCLITSLDGDSDVDQNDTNAFRACLSGPDQPFDPACLE